MLPSPMILSIVFIITFLFIFTALIIREEKIEKKEKENDTWNKKNNVSLREIEERILEEEYVKNKLLKEKENPKASMNKLVIEKKIEEHENRMADIQKN